MQSSGTPSSEPPPPVTAGSCGSFPEPTSSTWDPVASKTARPSRRRFLARSAVAGAALACLGAPAFPGQPAPARRFRIAGFTKPFQDLNFEDTADLVAEVGWDGIECPVRAGGQILPERVEEDLPRMVEALRRRNLELTVMATDIVSTTTPLTRKVLDTARSLGIRHYRLGFMHYRTDQPIPRQLDDLRAQLRDLAALNQDLGLCGGIQNHSGRDNVGAPVWDAYELVKGLDPKSLGIFFDIGHATLEGGLAWPLHVRLTQPHWGAVYVKDFVWQKSTEGWKSRWCPLGEGLVRPEFFQGLVRSPFSGVVCQHCEYELGTGRVRLEAMRKDLRALKQRLDSTG